jgi:predicted Zn-dependent peptidase
MPVALDVLADVVLRSTFPPDEIERERQVILQEIGEAKDDPESIAQDEFDLRAYPKQAFGRPILGNARFVKRVGRDDFRHYLGTHYFASNTVISAVGDIDHDRFADEVEKRFGEMPQGVRSQREAVRYVGGFRHVDDDYEQTSVALGWPAPARSDPSFPVYELLGELLGGGMSSPLFQAVRERHGLAYQIDAWTEGHEDCGLLQVTAGVAPRNLRLFFEVVCGEIRELTHRITPEDLERTRNQQATHLARSLERPMDLAETVARDLLVHGRVLSPLERIATTMAIGETELRQAARDLLSQPPTLVLVGRAGRGDHHSTVRRSLDH